jgi:archaellum biogenesis ATPase FlaH
LSSDFKTFTQKTERKSIKEENRRNTDVLQGLASGAIIIIPTNLKKIRLQKHTKKGSFPNQERALKL